MSVAFNYFNHCIALKTCCSAYSDWQFKLNDNYLTGSKTVGISYKTSADARVPWPWSINSGADGKHIHYNDFIAAPVALSDWSTGTPSSVSVAEDLFTEVVSDAEFCTGALNGMGALSNTINPRAIIPAAAMLDDQTDAWGDWYLEALVMEHDISTPTSYIMSGDMMRHCGKNWTYIRNGATATTRTDTLRVSVVCDTLGDVTVTMSQTGATGGGPNTISSFVVPGAAKTLSLFQCHMSSSEMREEQGANGNYFMTRDVTIRCWLNGAYGELRGKEWTGSQYSTPRLTAGSVQPWTDITLPNRRYSYPQSFSSNRCNIAAYASGKLDTSLVDEVILKSQDAWETNKCL